jgi:4-amino-4-deoxy-L-arabinose transferase-like glycosyltransferase
MMILLTCALGVLIFVTGRRLFGVRAGLLALVLFVVEPTVLAHGRIVDTDVPAALCWLVFALVVVAYGRTPSWPLAVALGAAAGVGMATKFSLLVLAPLMMVVFVAVAARSWRSGGAVLRHAGHATLAALAVLLVINASYGFDRDEIRRADVAFVRSETPDSAETTLDRMSALDGILPPYFLYGAWNVWEHNAKGHTAFLLGRTNDQGWWWYFPVAFALKTSLPFLLLAVTAIGTAAWLVVRRRERVWLALLVPLGVYLLGAMSSRFNVGVRHLLPAYPLLFLLAGACLDRGIRWAAAAGRSRPARFGARIGVAGVVAWCAAVAVAAYPDYVPYMNELACCAPDYTYLSDSNLEWGDAVGELADWLKDHGEREVQGVMAAGFVTLGLDGVDYVNLLSYPEPPRPTTYVAIGASFLNGSLIPSGPEGSGRDSDAGRRDFLKSYRDRTPIALFGGEIYLFRREG